LLLTSEIDFVSTKLVSTMVLQREPISTASGSYSEMEAEERNEGLGNMQCT